MVEGDVGGCVSSCAGMVVVVVVVLVVPLTPARVHVTEGKGKGEGVSKTPSLGGREREWGD